MPARRSSLTEFDEVLREAVRDFRDNGFDSEERLAAWQERLRRAAEASFVPWQEMEEKFREAMEAIYRREVDRGGVLRRGKGVNLFTLDRVRPALHGVLRRAILANAELIKLNRASAIEKTIQRFAGWATAQPAGGTEAPRDKDSIDAIRSGVAGMSYVERRVNIDQGYKLVSAINEVVAQGGGAIAAIWRSHYHDRGYDYREEHKDRELESVKRPYVVRGNWALEAGLMKLAGSKYTDEMTKPGEEIYCRCGYQYVFNLRDLPDEMLTAKGRQVLAAARKRS